MFRTFFSMVGTTFAKHLYLIIVIFPLKMPHVHEVWSWSLRGHRSSWQLGNMIRTTVSMVGTTFAKHLNLIIVIFLLKVSQVHEVWSWSLRGHKPSWQLGNMFRTTVSTVGTTLAKHLYLIIVIFHVKMPTVLEVWSLSLRGQDAPCSWSLELDQGLKIYQMEIVSCNLGTPLNFGPLELDSKSLFTDTLLVRSDTMDGFEYTENCLNERGKQDLQFWFYKFYGKFYQK